jgi:hypothetical protein
MPMTSSPRSSKRNARSLPIKPAAPVIRTFMLTPSSILAS